MDKAINAEIKELRKQLLAVRKETITKPSLSNLSTNQEIEDAINYLDVKLTNLEKQIGLAIALVYKRVGSLKQVVDRFKK